MNTFKFRIKYCSVLGIRKKESLDVRVYKEYAFLLMLHNNSTIYTFKIGRGYVDDVKSYNTIEYLAISL